MGTLVRTPLFYKQWMLAGNPAYFFDRLVKDYGDFIHYRGLISFYQVNHPSLVKQVLMDTHKTFDKHSIIYDRFRNVFGDGLVVAEGEKWRRQRKLMQPMFGPITVRRFFDGMLKSTMDMADRWKVEYRDQKVFAVSTEMDQITLKIAGQVLFSDGFEQDSPRIGHWSEVINQYCAKPPLPIIRSFWFPSHRNRKLKGTLKDFDTFISELIKGRRNDGHQDDLLSILLESSHEESGQPMADSEIKEEVLGMIIGGHETSSSALTWIWYELDQNPEVQKRLCDEIDAVVGNNLLGIEDLPRLTYTKMVIDEVLRLHPPLWFENRNAKSDVELGGTSIPKGSLVLFSRYSLHRHPDFWSNPDLFDPERHDPEKPENVRSSYALVPFGGGPRICIGMHFAIMELIVILATVAQRYSVVVAKQDRHEMSAKLTMAPKYGLKVYLTPR